jgi:hypothetical protein
MSSEYFEFKGHQFFLSEDGLFECLPCGKMERIEMKADCGPAVVETGHMFATKPLPPPPEAGTVNEGET